MQRRLTGCEVICSVYVIEIANVVYYTGSGGHIASPRAQKAEIHKPESEICERISIHTSTRRTGWQSEGRAGALFGALNLCCLLR